MRLKNKVIVVTASTRGIGLAIVKACLKEGALIYMAVRRIEAAQSIADELNQNQEQVKVVYCDASQKESYHSMIQSIIDQEGKIDVLVNNFGTSNPKKDQDIEKTDFHDFIDTLDINLASVFLTSQEVIPYMKKNGGGSIINISSIGGLIPDISQIAYGTSKAAINHLTKCIAVQEARSNIRCNAICPGMTATDAVASSLSPEFKDFFLKHIPIQRMGLPEEIAALVLYFASDESAYTTGQIIEVSGGFGLPTPVFGDLADGSLKR